MADDLGLWLRHQRQAHGWSAAEMARKLQQAARSNADTALPSITTLTSYIRRWEHGPTSPGERYQLHYCKALDIKLDQFGPRSLLLRPLEAAQGSIASLVEGPGLRTGPPSPGRSGHSGSYGDVEAPDKDAALRGLPGAAPQVVMTAIAEESRNFGEWADTSNVGNATLENYADQVRQIARDYVHAAPYPLLLDARRLRDRVFARLQGHQRPSQTRDLYLVGAQVCGLLAWMSGDMNFYRAAGTHAWTAWVCAEHADHNGARAWVRVTQSKLAYWHARYLESSELAEDGLRYSCSDFGQVMLGLFRARALARLGQPKEAAGSLTAACTSLERAGPDEVGGLWGGNRARYHGLVGNVHLWRHDPEQVLAEAGQALTLFEATDPAERNYGAQAHTHVDQAQAHLLLNDLDGANAALRPVLTLSPECRYEPIAQELGHVRQRLMLPEFHDAVVAAELQDEIETYCRDSIVYELEG